MNTGFGHEHNLLENAAGPGRANETVEVRGRTFYGTSPSTAPDPLLTLEIGSGR